jgi:tRNA(fMet)-specific endonuclease VapC
VKYLLDTCTISDFIKGDKNTLMKVKAVSPLEIAISTITLMEIHYGLSLNPKRAAKIKPIIADFVQPIHILDFNSAHATQVAQLRAALKEQGTPIGSYDILLAGVALQEHLIFVTSNTNEFKRVKNINIENWRE